VELSPPDAPPARPSAFPVGPGLAAFGCLLALYLWGGSSRAITVAATWWVSEPATTRLFLATALLAAGVALAVVGVILGSRAPDPRLRRAAVGMHLVILLAVVLAGLLGHLETRWPDAPEVLGVAP
jgi:hypothetical protein